MNPTTQSRIDRAAAQIVRQAGQLRVDQIADLPNRIRHDMFPIGIAVHLGPEGAVRYIQVRLGHADGFESSVAPELIQALVVGDTRRALEVASLAIRITIDAKAERQERMMAMTDDELRGDNLLRPLWDDDLAAEIARRDRLAPRARTREEREFGRAA